MPNIQLALRYLTKEVREVTGTEPSFTLSNIDTTQDIDTQINEAVHAITAAWNAMDKMMAERVIEKKALLAK